MSERYEVKDRVALSGLVVDVKTELTVSLFGELKVWWVENNGEPCCGADSLVEKRHLERTDAIDHGRSLRRVGRWFPGP